MWFCRFAWTVDWISVYLQSEQLLENASVRVSFFFVAPLYCVSTFYSLGKINQGLYPWVHVSYQLGNRVGSDHNCWQHHEWLWVEGLVFDVIISWTGISVPTQSFLNSPVEMVQWLIIIVWLRHYVINLWLDKAVQLHSDFMHILYQKCPQEWILSDELSISVSKTNIDWPVPVCLRTTGE